MKYGIVCDSAADLTSQQQRELRVTVVPCYVSLDGNTYLREGVDITSQEFYSQFQEKPRQTPSSAMPAASDFGRAMAALLEQGRDVLCICMNQKFSGSFRAALDAAEILRKEYPGRQIHVMDSQLTTILEGVLVSEAARLQAMELTLDEAVPLLEEIRPTGQIFFTTGDMRYLRDRLSEIRYASGDVPNVRPILHYRGGELHVESVCRGQKRSLYRLITAAMEYIRQEDLDVSRYVFGTGLGGDIPCYEEFVGDFRKRLEDNGFHPAEWVDIRVGAAIGVHTGPYPAGLGFIRKCDI